LPHLITQLLAVNVLPEIILSNANVETDSIDEILPVALRSVRVHLGMDVAFISEFDDGRRIFQYVDSAPSKQFIQAGCSNPLDESYCQRVIDGRIPNIIQDAAHVPAAAELPVTQALPVGAHISVPIILSDGRIYGTFCCFSVTPDPNLDERDLAIMRIFSEFLGTQIERHLQTVQARKKIVDRVISVIDAGNFTVVYQPIRECHGKKIVGFEALTRFFVQEQRSPDVWFAEAASVGMGELLEVSAIEKALEGLDKLPEDAYLSLNVSPESVLSGAVNHVLSDTPLSRIVLEVTEHVPVPDYSQFGTILEPLRKRGLRLAIDDAGAGYASFRHILKLNPDFIKLDMSLTRNIDADPMCLALAAALIRFAEDTGSKIIAEGVETTSELAVLQDLKVNMVQGYLVGRPMPLAAITQQLCT
jgi:EAL domain-containing protein (putative c-di-GMP-specific phosphodiesterase class I)